MKELDKVVTKKFSRSDGPFVKNLDKALSSFHVERQAYYGGTFVGNHVHSCLKVHIMALTKSLLTRSMYCRQITSPCCVILCPPLPINTVLPLLHKHSRLLTNIGKHYFCSVFVITSMYRIM